MNKQQYVGFLGSTSGRAGVARLLPGVDLLEGIEMICRDYDIKYGICWCHGSIAKTSVYIPGIGGVAGRVYEKRDFGQIVSATGVICETSDGKKDVHLHFAANDELCHFIGGHALKGKCQVGDTMDVIIMEIKGGKMLRKLDKNTGEVEFSPEPE